MTVPLGNTPAPSNTPDELKTPGLTWMGNEPTRGNPPVIVFYRTVEHGAAFAPNLQNIDAQTGRPKLVNPVTVDLYFPNGPLAGRVYRRVGFINSGITGPVRGTAPGSINVGQLGVGKGLNGDYPQLNALDPDALAWASKVHQEAGGDVFAFYGGGPSEPVQAAAPAPAPAADRFAGMPMPTPGGGQAAPQAAPQGPPPGMPGMGQSAPQGQPQGQSQGAPAGMPGLGAPPQGQPQPTGMAPPPGVPGLGAGNGQAPAGMPGWAGGQ